MASLPSLAINATLPKLEPDLKKLSTNSNSFDKQTIIETSFYLPLIQQCTDFKSLQMAEIIHAHAIKTNAIQDAFIATSLISTYMKCGSITNAHNLFDQIPEPNVVSWTALITGYVQNRKPELGLEVFVKLLMYGVFPTNYTLGSVLSACTWVRSAAIGEQIHGYIVKYGLEMDTSMGNSLCSLYSKCGRLDLAVKAFKRIEEKNVISWTTIVSASGDNGDADSGLRLFLDMLVENVVPNEFTLTSAMSLCCIKLDIDLGKQVHSLCIKYGCESLPVQNSIMYLYLKCGDLNSSKKLLNQMNKISLITWNAMIAGHAQMMCPTRDDYSNRQSGLEALNIFLKLTKSDTKPDLFTLSSILSVCSSLVALEQGEQIHAHALKSGYLSDVVVTTALVNMYNKCGCIENASKAFLEMPNRTLISWTSMITGFSQHGRFREAIELFEDMRLAGVRPNKVTFVGVLSACSHAGLVDEAKKYFYLMTNEYRIKPVMDHYACMVDMYVRLGRLVDAFEFIDKTGFKPNEIIWSILVAGCRSHGNYELAFHAAEKLLELKPKSIETYVLLLNMYISLERWQDVAKVRKMMKEENVGTVRDRSWVTIKDKVYYFKADDKSHDQSKEMYDFLEGLIEKAKVLGYIPYKSLEVTSDASDEEKEPRSAIHHSERVAVAFGLLKLPKRAPVRVMKNITMCRDCHSCIKYISMLTEREIVVRDSKRLHRFRDGQCSCGDFGALL